MTLFHNRRYMWPKAVLNCISKWRECRKTTRKYYYYTSCKLNKTGQSSLRRRPSLFIPTLRSLLSTLNFRWLASCLKGHPGLNIVIVSGSAMKTVQERISRKTETDPFVFSVECDKKLHSRLQKSCLCMRKVFILHFLCFLRLCLFL